MDQGEDLGNTTVLRIDAAEKEYVFENVSARPVPSLLRNFSAPVKMEVMNYTAAALVLPCCVPALQL